MVFGQSAVHQTKNLSLFNSSSHTTLTLLYFEEISGKLVTWCFKPSQAQRIISGLKETFIKRYLVGRPNKADIRPEEGNQKTESCRENLWNEIQLKEP